MDGDALCGPRGIFGRRQTAGRVWRLAEGRDQLRRVAYMVCGPRRAQRRLRVLDDQGARHLRTDGRPEGI